MNTTQAIITKLITDINDLVELYRPKINNLEDENARLQTEITELKEASQKLTTANQIKIKHLISEQNRLTQHLADQEKKWEQAKNTQAGKISELSAKKQELKRKKTSFRN